MILAYDEENTALEFTGVMANILFFLNKSNKPVSPSEIARNVENAVQSTISRNLQQLSIGGLVKVEEINGKNKECVITDEGKEALKKLNNGKKLMLLL